MGRALLDGGERVADNKGERAYQGGRGREAGVDADERRAQTRDEAGTEVDWRTPGKAGRALWKGGEKVVGIDRRGGVPRWVRARDEAGTVGRRGRLAGADAGQGGPRAVGGG